MIKMFLKKIIMLFCFLFIISTVIFAEDGLTKDYTINPQSNLSVPTVPVTFAGYFWVDTTYAKRKYEDNNPNTTEYAQTGRFVLMPRFKKEQNGYYAEAKADIMAITNSKNGGDYLLDTEEAWVKLGTKYWDFEAGRILGWEVYHKGQGMDLYSYEDQGIGNYSYGNLYGVDALRQGPEAVVGGNGNQFAIHIFPFENIRAEIMGVYGSRSNENAKGVRPVIDYSIWNLQFVVGAEWMKTSPKLANDYRYIKQFGYGGRIQFNSKYITTGLNYAHNKYDYADKSNNYPENAQSYQVTSIGGFIDFDFWENIIGFGYHNTSGKNRGDDPETQDQAFVSYLYKLPVDGLSIKVVAARCVDIYTDQNSKAEYTNDVNSIRVRVNYDFK